MAGTGSETASSGARTSDSGSSGMGDWVHVRSPFVYWAQTETTISLRVDIRNAQNPRISIEQDKIIFDAIGRGAQGLDDSEYHFQLDFPHSINPKVSTYRVLDRDVDILIQKEAKGWWDKITNSYTKKPAWLKVDFDRWKSPDDDEDSHLIPPDIMKDYPNLLSDLQTDEFGYKIENLRNVYLFLYNLHQLIGNLYIIGVLSIRYLKDGPSTFHDAYNLVGWVFCYCQLLQIFEILHPVFGFTKTSVGPAMIQVVGRLLILFGGIVSEPRIQEKPVIFFLFYIWSLADIIRYPYYLLQISGRNVYLVTWFRYTAWVLLYPAGIACEAVVIFGCIPYFIETGHYSIILPNKWNFTFSFPSFMRIYLLFGLIPVAYTLMQNMRRARAKALKTATSRAKPRIQIKKSN